MTRLERYKQRLANLEYRRNQSMRQGKYMQMQSLNNEIENVRKLIADAEEYSARPMKELFTREQIHESGMIPMLMECYLASDFLNDCVFELKQILKKLGVHAVTIVPEIEEIIKKSESFASSLCAINKEFSDFMTDNDTLIEALHKKTLSYIKQRMTPAKRAKSKQTKNV